MTILNHNDRIAKLELFYDHNKELFASFENVYLFGSLLYNDYSNDVDMLLVYEKYKPELLYEVERIADEIENVLDLPVDLTVLSLEELYDTEFLSKIKEYRIIK